MTAGGAGLLPQAEEVQGGRSRATVGPAEVKFLKLIHGDVVSAVLMAHCGPQFGPCHPEVVVVEEVRALVEQRVFMLHGAARWDLHAVSPSIHPCPQDLPPDAVCVLPGRPSPSSRFLCLTEVSKLTGKTVLSSLRREMMLRRMVPCSGGRPCSLRSLSRE